MKKITRRIAVLASVLTATIVLTVTPADATGCEPEVQGWSDRYCVMF